MARRLTFEDARKQYEEKFPDKKLLTFSGTLLPCTIHCDKHGEVDVVSFVSVKNSKHGCPHCGEESKIDFIKQRFNTTAEHSQVINMSGGSIGNNTNYFLGQETQGLPPEHLRPLPILGMAEAVGHAAHGSGYRTEGRERAATFVAPSDTTFAVRMPDNSMAPRIRRDNILIVEPKMRPQDEDTVLLMLPDGRGVVASLYIDVYGKYTMAQSGRASDAVPVPAGTVICGIVLEVKERFVSKEQALTRYDAGWEPKVVS